MMNTEIIQHKEPNKYWYAAKVFFNKTAPIGDLLDEAGVRSYIPSNVITSLAFFYSEHDFAKRFEEANRTKLYLYKRTGSNEPYAIPDKEMEVFIFVTSADQNNLIYLGDDRPEYHVGDKVRVTEGPFAGAVGHVKRIKRNQRLIISIRGIAALATTYIPPRFLEKIEEE